MRQHPPVDFCEWCGEPIPEGRMSRVYCSDDCAQDMYARYGDDYFWPEGRERGPVPGGPPMRQGNNPDTGIAWNE